jgi:hypothetical protein
LYLLKGEAGGRGKKIKIEGKGELYCGIFAQRKKYGTRETTVASQRLRKKHLFLRRQLGGSLRLIGVVRDRYQETSSEDTAG